MYKYLLHIILKIFLSCLVVGLLLLIGMNCIYDMKFFSSDKIGLILLMHLMSQISIVTPCCLILLNAYKSVREQYVFSLLSFIGLPLGILAFGLASWVFNDHSINPVEISSLIIRIVALTLLVFYFLKFRNSLKININNIL